MCASFFVRKQLRARAGGERRRRINKVAAGEGRPPGTHSLAGGDEEDGRRRGREAPSGDRYRLTVHMCTALCALCADVPRSSLFNRQGRGRLLELGRLSRVLRARESARDRPAGSLEPILTESVLAPGAR